MQITSPNTLIDLVDLAEQRDWLAARLSLDSFVRLRNAGVETLEDFDFQASVSRVQLGTADEASLSSTTNGFELQVAGQLRAAMTVPCQRCGDSMIHAVDRPIRWQVRSRPLAVDAAIEISEWDLFEADPSAAPVVTWIEDELIAALPLVARHRLETNCNQNVIELLKHQGQIEADTRRPFADLGDAWQARKQSATS